MPAPSRPNNPALDALTAPAESASMLAAAARDRDVDLRRRVTYLMLFRLVLISLVLGTTLLIGWFSDLDLAAQSSIILFGIIAATYVLTIVYALLLTRVRDVLDFAYVQLGMDLLISSVLVHVTGGAQSAYAFFFPVTIIGAATIRFRRGAVVVTAVSVGLFITVSLLGWTGVLPLPEGQRLNPRDLSELELARAIGLNTAAFVAVGFLSVNLAGQLLRTSELIESEREAAADLYTLHEDIVRCLSSGLLTVDRNGIVLTMNQAAREIMGLPDKPTRGTPLSLLAPSLAEVVDSLPARESIRRGEVELHAVDGRKVTLGISVSPLVDHLDRPLGRIVNFQDLTDMRQMEQAFKRAERLATIGTVAAGVAHELRNPLASISGSIELLREGPEVTGENRTLMEIVTREVDRLDTLITDLLDYTNPRPREVVKFDLFALVDETLHVFQRDPRFEAVEVSLSDSSQRQSLPMLADPAKLRQVLWNLLRNAAEAAATGGGHVELEVLRGDDQVVIEIRDDGPGIPTGVRDRIFEPFFTTRNRGTGLGLAIVQSIVAEHGGDIDVDSEVGRGAAFSIRLPIESEGIVGS